MTPRPMRSGTASMRPAAATIAGDGVSPAASAAASGSPPGSAADTAIALAGRSAGSRERQRWIDALDRRIELAPGAARHLDAVVVHAQQLGDRRRLEGALAGVDLEEDEAEREEVAALGLTSLPASCSGAM